MRHLEESDFKKTCPKCGQKWTNYNGKVCPDCESGLKPKAIPVEARPQVKPDPVVGENDAIENFRADIDG